jgi:hypothetical protein
MLRWRIQRFLQLAAGRSGQILNQSQLASDAGISPTACRSWLSVLETSGIVHLLRPHFRNVNKRITKSPKLYFVDTGLVCRLLVDEGNVLQPVEIKLGATIDSQWLNQLKKWTDIAGSEAGLPTLIHGGNAEHVRSGVCLRSWAGL